MATTKRLFFATHINPNPVVLSVLSQLKQQTKFDSISWANPEQMHITLRFFGDTPTGSIQAISKAIKQTLFKESVFHIRLKQLKIFGSKYRPKVLWLGVEDNGMFLYLFQKIKVSLAESGFPDTRQNFVPHLTLGRINHIDQLPRFQAILDKFKDFNAGEYFIDQFVLYESLLFPSGAKHISLECFPLK